MSVRTPNPKRTAWCYIVLYKPVADTEDNSLVAAANCSVKLKIQTETLIDKAFVCNIK